MSKFMFAVMFWSFILIKWFGTALAAWSWLWVLIPIVPTVWLALTKMGLL